MEIKQREMTPSVHPDANGPPPPFLSARFAVVPVGSFLPGAVLTANGGPVEVGPLCDHVARPALPRATRRRLVISGRLLPGPNSSLAGCTMSDACYSPPAPNRPRSAGGTSQPRGAAPTVPIGCGVTPGTRIPIGSAAIAPPSTVPRRVPHPRAPRTWGRLPLPPSCHPPGSRPGRSKRVRPPSHLPLRPVRTGTTSERGRGQAAVAGGRGLDRRAVPPHRGRQDLRA